MRPAYEVHRRVLQVLQRGRRALRWVLKSPVHLQYLPRPRGVPGRPAVVHPPRPAVVLPSVSSLIASMRRPQRRRRPQGIGRYHVDLYARTLDRYVDVVDDGTIDAARLTDSRHVDFLDDAIGVVRGLYEHFGWQLSDDAETAMHRYLADHDEGKPGHRYDPSSFGLDSDDVKARFQRYAERFGVQ